MQAEDQIGAYRIERELGRGGFGVVYVAIDTRLGRRAAIKQLLPELSGQREIVERFFNEAKAAANINHPGIVEIYDVGWHTDGSAYFAMKLLDGESLAKRVRTTGPLPIVLAATIARQVASALVAAHGRGIVHRDLKPDNIILVPDDEVAIGERATVLDFGIAKLVGDKLQSHKTRTGMMMGTPSYMSPEQCRGAGEVDHRTDVYALGCIVFEMLTGRAPFVAEGAGEILGMHQFVEPPDIRTLRTDLPAELAAIVMRMLAKQPDQRPAQMTELQLALRPFGAAGGQSRQQPAQAPTTTAPVVAPTLVSQHDLAGVVSSTAATAVSSTPVAPEPQPQPQPQPSTFSAARGEVASVEAPTRPRRTLAIVIGGLVVAGVAVAGMVALRRGDTDHTAIPDAGLAMTAPGDAVSGETPAVSCDDFVQQRRWDELARCSGQLAASAPEQSKQLAAKAELETAAAAANGELASTSAAGDLVAAARALERIPIASVYHDDAQRTYDAAFATAVAALHGELEAVAKDCSQFKKRLAKAELAVGTAVVNAAAANVTCGRVAARPARACDACPIGTRCENARCVPVVVGGDACATAAASEARGDQLVKQGVFAAAVVAYESAITCRPTVAARLVAAACRSKNAAKAKRHIDKVTASAQREAVTQLCLREGVDLRQPTTEVRPPEIKVEAVDKLARAKQLFSEGSAAFNAADYATAIARFKEAYELSPRAAFLFNIAKAYEKSGDRANASAFYKKFLAADPSSNQAPEVRLRLEELDRP